MQNLPKISVVMPSYNQAKFLEKSINSVLDQNYANLEFLILDGGSDDGSKEIIEKYESKLAYWRSRPDEGQSSAINDGLARATGEILCWLNSDDLHMPDTLFKVAEYFSEEEECEWLIGFGQFVDARGRPMWAPQRAKKVDKTTMADWYNQSFHQPSVFWRRSLWERSGPLDESFHYSMDLELWLRFLRISEPHLVDSMLSNATDHADMKTRSEFDRSYAELCHALFKNGYPDEGLWAIRRLAKKVFFFKSLFYPITRIRFLRYIAIRLFEWDLSWHTGAQRQTPCRNHPRRRRQRR